MRYTNPRTRSLTQQLDVRERERERERHVDTAAQHGTDYCRLSSLVVARTLSAQPDLALFTSSARRLNRNRPATSRPSYTTL